MENNKNIFSEALNDLKTIKENIKKNVEKEIIKEKEKEINQMVSKLLENEISGKEQTTEVEPETKEEEKVETTDNNKNVDFIDTFLKDLDLNKVLSNSDVESVDIDVIDTEGEPVDVTSDETGVTVSSKDNVDTDYSYLDSEDDDQPEEIESDEDLIDEEEINQILNNKQMDNNKETNANMDDQEIEAMLKEIEASIDGDDDLGEPAPKSNSDNSASVADYSDLDEAMIDELLKEFMDADDEDAEGSEEEIEEGMSAVSQTKKTVGTETASKHDGRPERRSNMSETENHEESKETKADEEKEKDALDEYKQKIEETLNKLVQENKKMAEENSKLKELNEKAVKRLEEIKNKLYEATVVSHKAASINQLFLENALNQKQKQTIVESFANVNTLDESKATLSELKRKHANNKIVFESASEKVTKTVVHGETVKLQENKIAVDPKTQIKNEFMNLVNYDPKKASGRK